MKPEDLVIEQVKYNKDGSYRAFAAIEASGVKATFEVSLSKRREREAWRPGKEYKHHKKPFEMLNDEARRAVCDFCKEVGRALALPEK